MPDGRSLVFSSLRITGADWAWRESEIYAVDAAGGEPRQLTRRKGPDGNPVISPDGRLIAYTGFDSTDATWKDAALYVMSADGSGPRALTVELDRSPQELIWAADNGGVYFTTEDKGYRQLYFVSLAGQVRQITTGKHILLVSDIGPTGQVVGVRSTALEPSDIVTFSLKAPDKLTQLLAAGITFYIGIQALINMSVLLGLLPQQMKKAGLAARPMHPMPAIAPARRGP